jgi:hypothetical protein
MGQIAELDTAPQTIEATLDYFIDTGATPVTLVGDYGKSDVRTGGGNSDPHRITLRNGRLDVAQFSIERDGFRFVEHHSQCPDFYRNGAIRSVYYPEMEELIKKESGASRVVIFDHTLRTDDQNWREENKIREVVRRVHNDYTEWSAPQRVRDVMGEEAEDLLTRRFAIVQVWRPIRHPVESWPLAIADAGSLAPEDMVVTERRYQNRTGQTYAITFNPDHRWYWFPRMTPDEALVFKVFDSQREGTARWTAHTAFADPTTQPGARQRESIEIRSLAFF